MYCKCSSGKFSISIRSQEGTSAALDCMFLMPWLDYTLRLIYSTWLMLTTSLGCCCRTGTMAHQQRNVFSRIGLNSSL